jgi:hypothetical protein
LELAERTGGAVYTSDLDSAFEDIETDILAQETPEIYISSDLPEAIAATVSNLRLTQTSASSVHIDFESDGILSFVLLDDFFAGFTEEKSIEITDLDLSKETIICVSTVSKSGIRGEAQCVPTSEISNHEEVVDSGEPMVDETDSPDSYIIPKAPNTGGR